jgi:hypothetical protein
MRMESTHQKQLRTWIDVCGEVDEMVYDPKQDGVSHLNVYSKARTQLGRHLSNFDYAPIETEGGVFASVEGYWYWLGCSHSDRDLLRSVSGYEAKALGRKLGAGDWSDSPGFKRKICAAIRTKVLRYYANDLADSTLPLCHYYVMQGRVIEPKEGRWVIEYLTELRESLRQGTLFG